jgi:hypothetical protein
LGGDLTPCSTCDDLYVKRCEIPRKCGIWRRHHHIWSAVLTEANTMITIALQAVLACMFDGLYNSLSIVGQWLTTISWSNPVMLQQMPGRWLFLPCKRPCELWTRHVAHAHFKKGFFVVLGAEEMWELWGVQNSVVRDCVQTFGKNNCCSQPDSRVMTHAIVCPNLGGVSFYFETGGGPVWLMVTEK